MGEVLTLSKTEDGFVHKMLHETGQLQTRVPEDLSHKEVLSAIRACASMLRKVDRATFKLKPVLGRLMLLARKNPGVYQEAGYDNYGDFLQKELMSKYGISRSTLYECRAIVKAFPNLDMEEYGKISTANLILLTKFTSHTKTDHKKLLVKAAETQCDAFKEWVVQKGYLDKSQVESGSSITFTGSRSAIRDIKKFFDNPAIKAYAESDNPTVILEAMIEEISIEWLEDGGDKIAQEEGNEA